jgi:large subunit ribosomal protein L25
MAEITLKAETGRPTGSRPTRRLRAAGKVPGVVYGLDNPPVPVTVEWRALRVVLTSEAGLNTLIDLDVDGESKLAIVKDLQRDPVHGNVRHADFLLIRRDREITVEVPLVLHGEAESVQRQDGLVDQVMMTLTVNAKPADIPAEIPVDISALNIGEAIRVGDLTLPSGASTDVDPDEAVVVAQVAPSSAELEAIEEADEEAAVEAAAEGGEEAEPEDAEADPADAGGEGDAG